MANTPSTAEFCGAKHRLGLEPAVHKRTATHCIPPQVVLGVKPWEYHLISIAACVLHESDCAVALSESVADLVSSNTRGKIKMCLILWCTSRWRTRHQPPSFAEQNIASDSNPQFASELQPTAYAKRILPCEEMYQAISTLSRGISNTPPSGKFRVSCDLCFRKHP